MAKGYGTGNQPRFKMAKQGTAPGRFPVRTVLGVGRKAQTVGRLGGQSKTSGAGARLRGGFGKVGRADTPGVI
jgi:hypothetical protein